MIRRKGMTQAEVLVVIAILGVLIGLLLPVIQKLREMALRIESGNNLRQISFAVHNFSAAHENWLPSADANRHSANAGIPFFAALLPYTDMAAGYDAWFGKPYGSPPVVKFYVSPADPTIAERSESAWSSYPANAQVFQGSPRFPATFADGISSTIAFAEHYANNCGGGYFDYPGALSGGTHRPTFADGGNAFNGNNFGDVYPVNNGISAVTEPSVPGLTFQVAPMPPHSACNSALAQTPHPSGMIVAMGDGSVRTLAPNISPEIYWGAVTPSGQEILGSDW